MGRFKRDGVGRGNWQGILCTVFNVSAPHYLEMLTTPTPASFEKEQVTTYLQKGSLSAITKG